jgi:DNA-binding NarL/FixJ family response regulator
MMINHMPFDKSESRVRNQPIRVLLVEDNDVMLRYLELSLQDVPTIEIVGRAVTAREALDKTAAVKPDLIVMDIGLPDINGIDATRLLKNRHAVKVLILTGSDDEQTLSEALIAGVDGYCLKPMLDSNELQRAIESVANGAGWLDKGIARKVLDMLKDNQGGNSSTERGFS